MGDNRLWLQRALTLIGVACLGWFGFDTVNAAIYQREQAAEFERLRAAQIVPDPPVEILPIASEPESSLIGMLDIPRLSMSTPVVRGDDDATLQLAAGHLPDTPKPWEPGNSAIAGHRDGLFRPLKNIRVGDEVFVRTTRGDLRYRVSDTRIVTPDDLSVLRPTASHTLTLITCYPFYYVGSAPKRFIVHAERVDAGAPPAVQPISDDVQIVAAGPAVETPKVRKAKAKKVSVDKRKPRKALAKRPMEKKAAGKVVTPAPKPGKVRGFFRKIGSFFKKPKPRATPETPSR